MCKWKKSLKYATVVSNQAAAFNRCVNKVHDDMQGNIRLLFNDMGKGKSSHKAGKMLNDLKRLVIFLAEGYLSAM